MSVSYAVKKMVTGTSLLALGTAFQIVSRASDELKADIAEWPEGKTFALGALPAGPVMAVRKEKGALRYLGKGEHGADLKIMFKNLDSAVMVLTGQIGADTAFAQHRAAVHGSLYEAMQANRAMALVTKYLFPGFMLKTLMKRPPRMNAKDYLIKAKVMLTLVPGLVINMTK